MEERVWATLKERVWATLKERVWATLKERVWATLEERVWATPYLLARVALLVIGLSRGPALPTIAAHVDHPRPGFLASLLWVARILHRPLLLSLSLRRRLDDAGLVQGRILRFHLLEHEVDQVLHEELFVAVREAQTQVGDAFANAGDCSSSTARVPSTMAWMQREWMSSS